MTIKNRDKETVKWIMAVSKKFLPHMVILTIITMISSCFGAIFALLSKNFINAATARDKNEMIMTFIEIVSLVLILLLIRIVIMYLRDYISSRLEITYKTYMFDKIIRKKYALISPYHSGDLLNRITSDISVASGTVATFIPSVGALITQMVSALIVIYSIDSTFAIVFVVGGILVFFLSRIFKNYSKKLYKQGQETEGKTRSFIQEAIENMLVIKVFAGEDKITKKAGDFQEENYKIKVKRRYLGIFRRISMNLLMQGGFIYALTWGVIGIYNGMDYGTVIALTQLVGQVQTPFSGLSSLVSSWFNLSASVERILDICNLSEENIDGKLMTKEDVTKIYNDLDRIEFKNISFKYDRNSIFENANLTINKGDFVTIMGISGIGKSTLMKLLLGVYDSEGEIKFKLKNKDLDANYYTRPLFSYVPQGNMLLSGTIRENIVFTSENITEDDINEAVRLSCADDFIKDFPQGLDTVIGEKGTGLSEGQTQRIAIARALVTKAPIILLDEATSALDEYTEDKLLKNLKNLNNMTCIIISHKRAALDICNRHIAIEDKKIVEVEDK
ncbi:MAG: ABC transporter ATP-binding protein [Clostridia bacterium]|nr:ABC transporter ATP-binding protein [Clostridia bacterium]